MYTKLSKSYRGFLYNFKVNANLLIILREYPLCIYMFYLLQIKMVHLGKGEKLNCF